MPGRVVDGSTVLREACTVAQDTFTTVAALEHVGDEAVPLTGGLGRQQRLLLAV